MKNKISVLCLSLLLLFNSCKKESPNSIVGEWRSVSVYTAQDNGTHNWVPVNGRPQFYNFSAEGKFNVATDVPAGAGSYNYDETSQQLILIFLASPGSTPQAKNLKVDLLDHDKLILSFPSAGNEDKTEYSRIN